MSLETMSLEKMSLHEMGQQLLTRFSNGKLVIKMMNVGGRAVLQASTIGFRSICLKQFEILE